MATNEKEIVARAPRGRPQRTSVGTRQRLVAKNTDPDFKYRFVTDKDGRVEDLLERGYVIADGKEEISVSRLSVAATEGSAKTVHVGNGDKGILMKIRKDWYEEDQEAKQRLINEREQTMLNDRSDGKYGKFSNKDRIR